MTKQQQREREVLPVSEWQWLADQLRAWPDKRVHPDRTMCDGTLRPMAADVIEHALGLVANLPRDVGEDEVERVFFSAVDPTVNLDGSPVPAATTLLYRVCDNNPERFEEVARLVNLFIHAALATRPAAQEARHIGRNVEIGPCAHCKGTGKSDDKVGMSSDDSKCWWCQGRGTRIVGGEYVSECVAKAESATTQAIEAAAFEQAARVVEEMATVRDYYIARRFSAAIRALSPTTDPAMVMVPREQLGRVRTSMAMLQQHTETCAVIHCGGDIAGWLRDTRTDLNGLTAMLAAASPTDAAREDHNGN